LGKKKAKVHAARRSFVSACFGATQDCKNSLLETEKVERRYLATSKWLGNCLHKHSLGALQDLETEMCDGGKSKKPVLVKVV
ncbi:MAG TPA: hypothetical protein DHV12_05660, partial [Thermotogae bacterium]|nr:hypothetical protein [Thermotogota bacterium]